MDKGAKSNVLRACKAVPGTQNWTSYTRNAGTGVSYWVQKEYNMHKKKLCSSDMAVYAAMFMIRDMVNAFLCNCAKNYSLLDDLTDTFKNAHEDMNGYCDRELV